MGNWLVQSLIGLAITIPLSALVLMISTKIFKLQDTSYVTAIKITAIIGVLGFVLDALIANVFMTMAGPLGLLEFVLLNIVLAVILIQKFYKIDLKKTLLVWLVWFLLGLVVLIVVGFIIGIIMALFIPLEAIGY